MTLRTSYSGALNSKLAEARQAGYDLIATTNLADLTTQMTNAAGHGQRSFTVNYAVTYQPADLRGSTACNVVVSPSKSATCACKSGVNNNGPLWPAFESGVYQALHEQDIMIGEVTVRLNTSDQLATSIDLIFSL